MCNEIQGRGFAESPEHRGSARNPAGLVILACLILLGVLLASCASGPPPSATERGEAALAAGDWESARTAFSEALRATPQSGRAWHGMARAALLGRDPESALRALTQLSKADPDRFRGRAQPVYRDALEAATHQRLARDQSEAALASVRGLARLEPKRRGLARLLGQALVAEGSRRRLLGEREASLGLYQEACRVTPDQLDAWIAVVEIFLEKRDHTRAMAALEAARKQHPTAGVIRSLTLQALQLR